MDIKFAPGKAPELIDMTGMKFGRLTVKERVESYKHKGTQLTRWLCECKCGNTAVVMRHNLISGRTNSCGCLRREQLVAMNKSRAKKVGAT